MSNPFENLFQKMLLLKLPWQQKLGFPTSLVLVAAGFMAQGITTAIHSKQQAQNGPIRTLQSSILKAGNERPLLPDTPGTEH